jgi:hypothetical protein
MRHLIILPGNSLKNKAWGELMQGHYGPHFDSSFMLEYDHWASGEANIDFAKEEEKLRAHVATLAPDTEIILMAKSAGSLLALLAVFHSIITPVRVVFFGMPLDLAATDLFKDAWEPLSHFSVPALAFHNLTDPTTSYEFTRDTLAAYAPHISRITTYEPDHWYGDTKTYDPVILPFIAG